VPSAVARTSTPRSADPARPPAVGGIVRDSPF
jgi:hypothetical protein